METKHKQFKPYDRVLVRDAYNKWRCDIYSHYDKDENNHWVIGFGWTLDEDILPYEGNEHLVGTTYEPEEEIKLKVGEYLICFDNIHYYDSIHLLGLVKFTIVKNNLFYTSDSNAWQFVIRCSDFNPNDMEETRKHILCVKDGKIVKYKE